LLFHACKEAVFTPSWEQALSAVLPACRVLNSYFVCVWIMQ